MQGVLFLFHHLFTPDDVNGVLGILLVRCGLECGRVCFDHRSQNVVNSTVISRTPQESAGKELNCKSMLNNVIAT